MWRTTLAVLAAVGITVGLGNAQVAPLAASAPASKPTEEAPKSIWGRETLTGNWFGAGDKLEETGLAFKLNLTQVYQQNLRGGLATGRHAGRYQGSYDLEGTLDTEKAFKLPGGEIYALARGGWSDGLDASSIGSLFGANADAMGDHGIVLWQLFYEQKLLSDRVRIRVGRVDLTGAFECRGCKVSFDGNAYANDETSQFLNTALVNNPTIPFPEVGLGALVHVQLTDSWYISAGVADADAQATRSGFESAFGGPADAFAIFETGYVPEIKSAKGVMWGAYRVGLWYDPQAKERLDDPGHFKRDDVGFYTSCEQMVWKENAGDDTQGLGLFARYGLADGEVNEIRNFWSTGLQYQGLLPTRDNDVLAFGVAQGLLSPDAGFSKAQETVLEMYYKIQVTGWMTISPDFQYIFHPGADAGVGDAVVVGARMQMSF